MRGKQTIVINGRQYDAVTGMPIQDDITPKHSSVDLPSKVKDHSDEPVRQPAERNHHPLHHHPHKSITLRRDIVKKPHGAHDKAAGQHKIHVHTTKSPSITKFAPHPVMKPEYKHHVSPSPQVAATHAKIAPKELKAKPLSSRELKDHLITKQLESATPQKGTHKQPRTPFRVTSIMAACLAVMILGGYLSYINMPGLSVRVAAAQSGVNANFPSYTPSGYRFDGPVSYSNGQILLSFEATGGTTKYQIKQQKSLWDSQAVLDNYVATKTDKYDVNISQGLTIYTYDNNASWVNKGILYTISGNAPLRTEQVLKIATSL